VANLLVALIAAGVIGVEAYPARASAGRALASVVTQ
jgi:hypothetical protein